jgi:hypothetical protein
MTLVPAAAARKRISGLPSLARNLGAPFALPGANPGEMPVQVPTKFELVLNLKTAKTLGLEESPRALLHALQCNSSCNSVRARHVTVMHSIARSLLEYANNARRRRRRVSPTVASCVARSVRKREQQGKRLV